MTAVQTELTAILKRAAKRLRGAGLPAELAERMEELAKQVHQPCVVAVVGRVKVGKSTFVNALLREDLAKVGTTETTATINYFSYGNPDPNLPTEEILDALREAIFGDPRLTEMPAEEVARQLVLGGHLQEEPSPVLVADMLDALDAEEGGFEANELSEEGNPT